MKSILALSVLLLVLATGSAFGQIPSKLSYQGVLTDAAGAVVADGNYQLTFRLYAEASGGVPLWSETQSAVAVTKGVFSVILGNVIALDAIPFDAPYFLGITIGAPSGTELAPRIALTAAPYSLNSRSTGDITKVTVNPPLFGGGDQGDITVGLAVAGIAHAYMGPNAVDSGNIIDFSIMGTDLATSAGIKSTQIADEPGLNFTTIASPPVLNSSSLVSLGSITVNVPPASGYVMLTLTGNATFSADATMLDIGFGTTNAVLDIGQTKTGRQEGAGVTSYTYTFSMVAATGVTGGSRTFFINAQREAAFGTGTITLANVSAVAVFYTTRY